MIDVYIGKLGVPDSVLALEFDTFAEASEFCDNIKDHYKEDRKMLYMAIDRMREFESLEEIFRDDNPSCEGEIDAETFGKILNMVR